VAAQASWLAPLALIGGLAALLGVERRLRGNVQLGGIVLWGGWLLTAGIVYSGSKGIFHPYYISFLAPALGGTVAIAVASHWRSLLARDRLALFAPAALLATAVFEVVVMRNIPDYKTWLVPAVIGATAFSVGCFAGVLSHAASSTSRVAAALIIGLGALFLPPFFWTATLLSNPPSPTLPFVAPPVEQPRNPFGFGPPGATPPPNLRLIDYLVSNRGEARFLAATESAMNATPIIIATGEPVMAMGGFSGTDPAIDLARVVELVRAGDVRFFLLGGVPLAGGPQNYPISRAVSATCKAIPSFLWGGPPGGGAGPFGFGPRLFDCQGEADALRRSAGG
jgi:4-amino-4-deoxy-L-arabinose transferase-like glycosyltransferase